MARPAHARGGTCYLCAAPRQYANPPPLSHNAPAFPAISPAPAKPRGAACRRHPRRDAPTSLPIPAKSRRRASSAAADGQGHCTRLFRAPARGWTTGRARAAAGEQRGGRRARALHPSVSRPGEGLDDGAREGGGGRAARRQAGKGIAPVCFGPRRGAGRRGARGRRAGTRRAGAPLPAPPLPFAARAPALPFSSVSRPAHAPLPAPPAFRPARRKNCARAVHARAVVLY